MPKLNLRIQILLCSLSVLHITLSIHPTHLFASCFPFINVTLYKFKKYFAS